MRAFLGAAALASAWFALRAFDHLVRMAALHRAGGRYVPAGELVRCRECGHPLRSPSRAQASAGAGVRWCEACGARHEFGPL